MKPSRNEVVAWRWRRLCCKLVPEVSKLDRADLPPFPVQDTGVLAPPFRPRPNPWNEFQHRMKGSGLPAEQVRRLYYKEKHALSKS